MQLRVRRHQPGANINLGTLGSVPSATNAGHASSAATATNASHAANADSATNASHATSADSAETASALGSVSYRFDTSAGAVIVPACADNPCTPDKVGTTSKVDYYVVCASAKTVDNPSGLKASTQLILRVVTWERRPRFHTGVELRAPASDSPRSRPVLGLGGLC